MGTGLSGDRYLIYSMKYGRSEGGQALMSIDHSGAEIGHKYEF